MDGDPGSWGHSVNQDKWLTWQLYDGDVDSTDNGYHSYEDPYNKNTGIYTKTPGSRFDILPNIRTVTTSGGKFIVDGISQKPLYLIEGNSYVFNYPQAHPFRFSTTADGSHGGGSVYLTGVTVDAANNRITIVISSNTPTLYYYCMTNSGMGGIVYTPSGVNQLATLTSFTDVANRLIYLNISPHVNVYYKEYAFVVRTIIGDGSSINKNDALNFAELELLGIPEPPYWQQKGQTIFGEHEADFFGIDVSSSSDGKIIAVGAVRNDSDTGVQSDNHGHVRVFEWRKYTSADTTTYHHESSIQSSGQTKPLIFTESYTTAPVIGSYYWSQKGLDINGANVGDAFGYSLSLSSDGLKLAVGANLADVGGTSTGSVSVYEYGINDWIQMGEVIHGEASQDGSGESVSLSSDGSTRTIVAIGSKRNNSFTGHVRVYKYREYTQSDHNNETYHYQSREQGNANNKPLIITTNTSTQPVVGNSYWTQLGDDINGQASGDKSGTAAVLSGDGNILAIGASHNDGTNSDANYNSGHVRVYKYNNTSAGWDQRGSDIDGETQLDNSGNLRTIDMSSSGDVLIVGATKNDGDGGTNGATINNSGHARVYEYNTTSAEWERRGFDIDGEFGNDKSGIVSMNGDGTIIATGGPRSNDHFSQTRIFKWREFTQADADKYHYQTTRQGLTSRTGNSNIDNEVAQNLPLIITESFSTEPVNGTKYWTQIGTDIEGEANSLSLSDNGNLVTVGAMIYRSNDPSNNIPVGNNTKVFEVVSS